VPEDRAVIASIASHLRWAFEEDRTAATEPARSAFMRSFEDRIDPEGVLDPDERARRAQNLVSAHFKTLARKSAAVRRARGAARRAVANEATT